MMVNPRRSFETASMTCLISSSEGVVLFVVWDV
jgi:hypothetical protein